MRLREEIQDVISRLDAEKPHIPRYNAFGEDNHEKIDLIIQAIQEGWDYDEMDAYIDEHGLDYGEVSMTLDSVIQYNNGEDMLDEIFWLPEEDKRETDKPEVAPMVQPLASPAAYGIEEPEEEEKEVRFCNKKTCNDCPFSNKSLRGFLADYTIEDFEKYQQAQFNFPCHKHMTGGDDSPLSVHLKVDNGEMPLCRGYVESLIKSGADVSKNETLQKAIETAKADGLNDNTMSIDEFKEFHDLEKVFGNGKK